MHIFILSYLVVCWLIGILGRNRRMGFWGYFFGSILLTPIFGLLHIFVSEPRRQTTKA
jgi:hypothetical protein